MVRFSYALSVIIFTSKSVIVLSVHVYKKGLRVLGISESFRKGISKNSVLAGVVMRTDQIIDGFVFSQTEVGGMDATQKVIEMYRSLKRDDINILLLNGCVISWYNIIDLNFVAGACGVPLICVTYKDSGGLDSFFKENFPDDWQRRIDVYKRNGVRKLLKLHTGYDIYVRFLNIDEKDVLPFMNKITIQGAVSEPLRIARLLARALMKNFEA